MGKTTRTLQERSAEHIESAAAGVGSHFYTAVRKYGEDSLYWEVLEDNLLDSELDDRERYWIRLLDTQAEYNMTPGGTGGPTTRGRVWINNLALNLHKMIPKEELQIYVEQGWASGRNRCIRQEAKVKKARTENPYEGYEKSKRIRIHLEDNELLVPEELLDDYIAGGYTQGASPSNAAKRGLPRRGRALSAEQKEKQRQALIGIPRSEEDKKKIREGIVRAGPRKLSPETRERMRQAHLGKELSSEQRKKIGESQKGVPKSRRRENAQC